MAAEANETPLTLQSKIPTGPWTLYFHSSAETKWTLNTFVKIGTIVTWNHFWAIMDAIGIESFSEGMFFMMRDPSPPLWESHYHIRGGCYSFRCHKKNVPTVFLDYIIAAMINTASTDSDNFINGLSISPKRGFNIIKVWNSDSQKFHTPTDINCTLNAVQANEIIYTPFVQKNMF